jgi:ABC-type sugar transport system ATPase subunit
VLISHNMQNVLEVCTRAVVLRHGSVVADVPIAGVSARDLIHHITGTA